MENLTVRVQTIKHVNQTTRFVVFTAVVLKHLRRSNAYKETADTRTFVGTIMAIFPGDRFAICAIKQESPVYGFQYKILSYHREEPGTLQEIKRYLSSISKLGTARIGKIMTKYGIQSLKIIQEDEHALDGMQIPKESISQIRADLVNGACFEEILSFLQLHELDHRYAMDIYNQYGNQALAKMRDNPYALYLDNIIDFKTADKLNHALKYDWNTAYRVKTAIFAYLREDSETHGNLYTKRADIKKGLSSFLRRQKTAYTRNAFSKEEIKTAIRALESERHIVCEYDPVSNEFDIYLNENFKDELTVVKHILKICNGVKRISHDLPAAQQFLDNFEKSTGKTLATKQREAVLTALSKPISILTGGPGTGKTQTINAMIQAVKTLTPKATIRICAPTGKAALRVSELTGMKAMTIHRLLGIGRYNEELKEGELLCDYLFVDEYSMADCNICARLFSAASEWTRVVLIGDFEQLPSVGPGLILRDLIASKKIPTTHLTEIFRQAGTSHIITNAHSIIEQTGDKPVVLKLDRKAEGSFFFMEREMPTMIQKCIITTLHRLIENQGYEMKDIKVLSALRGTDLGTETLNRLLQAEFNAYGEIYEQTTGAELRVGDPVIHTHNNYNLNVFNGETGIVKALGYDSDKALLIQFSDGKNIWYNTEDAEELDLAYVLTVHRAQGSEFKVVLSPVHPLLLAGLSKNLIYTACTRAKEKAIFIGKKEAFSEGIRRTTMLDRNSKLIERLQNA